MTRENTLRERLTTGQYDLIVDLYLYSAEAGGKKVPIGLGYGCPCSKDISLSEAWDGYPLLHEKMAPGEHRRVGFFFLSGKLAADALTQSEKFFLWEGRLIGEATIVR